VEAHPLGAGRLDALVALEKTLRVKAEALLVDDARVRPRDIFAEHRAAVGERRVVADRDVHRQIVDAIDRRR
jgi:hypothetical protein